MSAFLVLGYILTLTRTRSPIKYNRYTVPLLLANLAGHHILCEEQVEITLYLVLVYIYTATSNRYPLVYGGGKRETRERLYSHAGCKDYSIDLG